MIIALLIVLGLCLGSFTNALVWRLHERSLPKKKRVASDNDLSIAQGRSMCPICQHRLAWYDLLPVISWLALGGKCQYCKKPISWHYPLVELATAGLFAASYIFWPSILNNISAWIIFAFWLIFLTGFMALIAYDLRWMILPDKIVYPLICLAVANVIVVFITKSGDWKVLLSALLGVICSAGIFYAIFQISNGKWIGGGDVKLAVVLGLLLGGPLPALLMLFIASLMGSVVGLPLILLGQARRNTKLPFGPFLMIATIIVFLFGSSLIAWYKTRVLLI